MKQFLYEAYGTTGNHVNGAIEADSIGQALAELSRQGLRPYKTTESTGTDTRLGGTSQSTGLSLAVRARLMRQLATLIAAGVAPDRALRIQSTQAVSPAARRVIDAVLEKVVAGQPLSTAMGKTEAGFTADELGLLRAGEHTGALPVVLAELATLQERRLTLRGQLTSSLIYPAFLLAMVPVILAIIGLVLVPNLRPLFESSGASMPLILQVLIAAGDAWASNRVLVIVVAAAAIAALVALFRLKSSRALVRQALSSLPGLRIIARKSESARLSRTMGSLLRSGSALQSALAITAEVTATADVRKQLEAARDGVAQGERLSRALSRVTALEPGTLQMVAIGEETNKVEAMLLYVAEQDEQAVASALDRFMALLTPLLTVAIGLLVGGIVMSIMRAILSINDLAAP
jgi:general secretion pathway protein F